MTECNQETFAFTAHFSWRVVAGFRPGRSPATEARMRWKQVGFVQRTIRVGRSKTKGSEGRVVPLNNEAFEILAKWHSRFETCSPIISSFRPSSAVLMGKKATCMEPSRSIGWIPRRRWAR